MGTGRGSVNAPQKKRKQKMGREIPDSLTHHSRSNLSKFDNNQRSIPLGHPTPYWPAKLHTVQLVSTLLVLIPFQHWLATVLGRPEAEKMTCFLSNK